MKPRDLLILAALLPAFLAGCAARDLYEPPTAPFEVVGRLALPAQAQDVDILGTHAYVAAGQAGLLIIDIADPANPRLVKILDTTKYAYTVRLASLIYGGRLTDVAFVVEGTEGITSYDITDPENAYSFYQGTTAVDGNSIYVEQPDDPSLPTSIYLAESWKGVRIFQTDPGTPGLMRYDGVYTATRGFANGVCVRDGYAYVADDEMGITVLDARVLQYGRFLMVSSCDAPGNARAIDMDGPNAFMATDAFGLTVMTIAEEGTPPVPTPRFAASLPLAGRSRAIVVRDGIAFIAAQDGGVHLVEVSNPAAPRLLGTVLTLFATGVAISPTGIVAVSDRDEGLVLLDGHRSFTDHVAPAAVIDLAAAGIDSATVRLTWHAPGDDRLSGRAASYEIRYGSAPITTDEAWSAATPVTGAPAPSAAGAAENFEVTGLAPNTTYHLALRTSDEAGNVSERSNSASGTTAPGNVPPSLTAPSVSPAIGFLESVFTLEVTYLDYDNEAPTEASVVIDGVSQAMSLVSGGWDTGALFRLQTRLDIGSHQHRFRFSDGVNPPVETALLDGPAVGRLMVTLGSPPDEPGRDTDEAEHTVVFAESTWIADHEVTQDEYAVYATLVGIEPHPSRFTGDGARPVERVSWFDAVRACNARSVHEGLQPAYTIAGDSVSWNRGSGGYRLPTEAEWERAARAGTTGAFPGGSLTEQACGVEPSLEPAGWYCGNAGGATHAVATRAANAWGLFDMNGNVWEWCWDWYAPDPGSGFEPTGPPDGDRRVIRSGSWYHFARDARSASRAPYWPNSADDVVGFRMARTIPGAGGSVR